MSYQLSRKGDKVSSNQDLLGYKKFFVGESEDGEVVGINFHTWIKDGDEDGLGNHLIQTYENLDDLKKSDPESHKQLIESGLIKN